MNKKNNNNKIIVIVLAVAYFLFGFKKKLTPSVEVGEGDFGDFGTDGEFPPEDFHDELFDTDVLKTPDYSPLYTAKVPEQGSILPNSFTTDYYDYGLKPLALEKEDSCYD